MKNNYDKFFKSARAQKLQTSDFKKVNIKKLQKKSQSHITDDQLKTAIAEVHRGMIKNKQKKLGKQFPVTAGVLLAASLIVAVIIGYNSDKAEEIISTIEIKILGTTASASETPAAAKNSQTKDKKTEGTAEADAAAPAPEKEKQLSMTPEELALFKNLEERRKALDQREAELKKLDEELQKQKEELDKRLVDIEQVRKSIANQLEEKVKVDQERVDQLVSFYSSMKAQQAAKIIETLNEDLAVEVLLKMKKKSAAEVMNLMAADKAQRLSEKFAGYRRK